MNTKKFGRYGLLCLFLIFCIGLNTADAQRSRDSRKKRSSSNVDEYFDESGNFGSKLWYGGQFIFFLSNNNFNIGLAPMVGYKITDGFSIGPAARFEYYTEKVGTNLGTFNFKSTTYGGGLFGRAKVFNNIFAHIQYELENTAIADTRQGGLVIDPNDTNDILTRRVNDEAFYIGAGYNNSTGLWGFEFMFLYDVLEPDDSEILPFDFRFGVNYNF